MEAHDYAYIFQEDLSPLLLFDTSFDDANIGFQMGKSDKSMSIIILFFNHSFLTNNYCFVFDDAMSTKEVWDALKKMLTTSS